MTSGLLFKERVGWSTGGVDNNFRKGGDSLKGEILLEIRVFFFQLRDEVALESAAFKPLAEIDEIVHDILTMMSWSNQHKKKGTI